MWVDDLDASVRGAPEARAPQQHAAHGAAAAHRYRRLLCPRTVCRKHERYLSRPMSVRFHYLSDEGKHNQETYTFQIVCLVLLYR